MSIEDRLRTFIVEEIRNGWVPEEVTDELHLIRSGVVDSLGIFELVALLEREYGIDVRDDELVVDHFETVHAIADFVRSKRADPSPSPLAGEEVRPRTGGGVARTG